MGKSKNPIQGVIFDLDGTLIDIDIPFDTIRKELGIPEGDILKAIKGFPAEEQERAYRLIDEFEYGSIPGSRPVEGMRETLAYLAENDIPYAVVTRGSKQRSEILLRKHEVPAPIIIGREDTEPKPSPEAVRRAAELMDIPPERLLVVGDYFYDIEAGNRAGCRTALLKRPWRKRFKNTADFSIDGLEELVTLLEE